MTHRRCADATRRDGPGPPARADGIPGSDHTPTSRSASSRASTRESEQQNSGRESPTRIADVDHRPLPCSPACTTPTGYQASMSTGVPRRVAYVHSDELLRVADCLPANEGRASLVHALVDSYSLLTETAKEGYARVVEPLRATREQLVRFHDERFIGTSGLPSRLAPLASNSCCVLSRSSRCYSRNRRSRWQHERPRLGRRIRRRGPTSYAHLWTRPRSFFASPSEAPQSRARQQYRATRRLSRLRRIARLRPARRGRVDTGGARAEGRQCRCRHLVDRRKVRRHGNGTTGPIRSTSSHPGRHHARRAEAAGFCYVADAVLAIMELRSAPGPLRHSSPDLDTPPLPLPPPPARISRVLYLDLDLHHGDGVESAFFSTPHVLTLSIHLFAPLFFPASGALESAGPVGRGRTKPAAAGHALNVALEPGLAEDTLKRVWESCIEKVASAYDADAIVLQLGVDGLAGDPCKVRHGQVIVSAPALLS